MKIAVWHNLPSGGGKRALYHHVKGLVERGHQVEAWCPSTADQTYLPLSDLIRENILSLDKPPTRSDILERILLSRRNPAGRFVSYYRYLTSHYRDTVARLEAMDRHCRQCAEAINCSGSDLLFANGCLFHRMTAIGRYVSLPKVMYLQEPYREIYEARPWLPWIAPPAATPKPRFPQAQKQSLEDLFRLQALRIQAREERDSAEAFQNILVNSFFSRESVLRTYGLDASVCYLGVDTSIFRPLGVPKEDFIVGLSSFLPQKNVRLVIEAIARITQPRPRLVWIGNIAGDYLQEMIRLAHSLDVCFEPLVLATDQEIVSLLSRALLMVYAPRLEPFGYAPLEANACGTPVVAVAEGGVRETIIDGINGLLVDHDSGAIANAIQRLRADPALARRLGEQGVSLVAERWSMSTAIDRLEGKFNTLLSKEGLFT